MTGRMALFRGRSGTREALMTGSPRALARRSPSVGGRESLMNALAAALGLCAVIMFGAMPLLGHVSLVYAFVAILLLCGSEGVFALSLSRREPVATASSVSAKRARRLVVAIGGLWWVVAVVTGLVTIVLAIPVALTRPTAVVWMELAFALLLLVGAVGWFLAYRRSSRR